MTAVKMPLHLHPELASSRNQHNKRCFMLCTDAVWQMLSTKLTSRIVKKLPSDLDIFSASTLTKPLCSQ